MYELQVNFIILHVKNSFGKDCEHRLFLWQGNRSNRTPKIDCNVFVTITVGLVHIYGMYGAIPKFMSI